MDVRFPANVAVQNFLTVVRANGTYTFGVDYTKLGVPIGSVDPTADVIVVFNTTTGVYNITTLAALIAASAGVRVITAAGDVNVGISDGLIILNKTVSQVTNVNLPPSATKIGKVKIVDFKGDSGSFPITVFPNGSEKFNDGQTSWPISGAGASATFDPITTGIGYAV